MSVPTATAEASLYRASSTYRAVAPGRVRSRQNVALADSCYDDCMWDCRLEGWDSYECTAMCRHKCTGPPPCYGELCLHGPQRRCCPYGTTCCQGYEYPSLRSIINCCEPGEECCGGKCCEPGHTCCYNGSYGKCCPPGQECCDGVCYTPGQGIVCTGDGTACPEGHVCGDGCCFQGDQCIDGKCCKPGPLCGGTRCCEGEQCTVTGCCPQERYTAGLGCCPQGHTACKVRVWPPPGMEGDPPSYLEEQCCPPGHICLDEACCQLGDCCRRNADCPAGKHCDSGKCCSQGQEPEFDPDTGDLTCA
jgi:hypothetical protein